LLVLLLAVAVQVVSGPAVEDTDAWMVAVTEVVPDANVTVTVPVTSPCSTVTVVLGVASSGQRSTVGSGVG
jgi:hypothetical protein